MPKTLTEDAVVSICRRMAAGERALTVAAEYGVRAATIRMVWRGDIWTQVDVPRLYDMARGCEECDGPIPRAAMANVKFCSHRCAARAGSRRRLVAAGGTPQSTGRGEVQAWITEFALSEPGNECVPWPFARNVVSGYAVAFSTRKGRSDYAYRVIWEKVNDRPFPDLEARHTCGKGADGCVNWMHITPGTPAENAADKIIHGTLPLGDKVHNAVLDDAKVIAICHRLATGETVRALAAEFGLNETSLGEMWRGETWTHVEVPRLYDLERRCRECGKSLPALAHARRKYCGARCRDAWNGRVKAERQRRARMVA